MTGPPGPVHQRSVTILNRRGLHARAAARFVKLSNMFESEIEVSKDGETVSGHSIMGLMMLAAATGSVIRLTARGPDAADAVHRMVQLVENKFDEE